MKHIVFVIGNYKNGGVPMRSTNLANEFAKNGFKTTILVTKDIAENVFFEHHENVNIVSLKEYVNKHVDNKNNIRHIKKIKRKIKVLKYLRYISKLFPKWDKKLATEIKGLRKGINISSFIINNPESIYIPFGISYYEMVYYGAKGTDCKIIYAERNAPEIEFAKNNIDKNHVFNILSEADGAVLQTKDELSFFENKLKNAVVINNPVKANLPKPFKGERRKVIVNFCRIAEQKNLPLMINAFIEFHNSHPDYTLEIYGNTVEKTEEELKQKYVDMISSLNAKEYIKLLPPRGDIHTVVKDCAMFVSSSDFEGLSNSMIEAMAIGLPCICTDCLGGGAREIITDGENGLLVPMNDAHALSQAMCRLATDKNFSEKCSENASKIRDNLSAETISQKWLEFIKSV